MGFGLLLIGYIISYVSAIGFGPYLFAGILIGGTIMLVGLVELRKYAPTFVYAIIADTLLLFCSFYAALVFLETRFGLPVGIVGLNLKSYFDWAQMITGFIFNITMLYGIADLARRVELFDMRVKAYRNMIFVLLFNVLQFILAFPISVFDSGRAGLTMILIIFQLTYTIINAVLIFKCYAMICPEGQENMHRRRSRFEFINKMRKIQDDREEQVVEGAKKFIEEKLKKNNRQSNDKKVIHHHKKKRKR